MRQTLLVTLFLLAGVLIVSLPVCAWSQSSEPNPGIQRPVTTQELEQLKRRIYDETRSNIEGVFEYHTESGDPNNRLDSYRVGARLNLKPTPETLLQIRGTHTPYSIGNDVLTAWGTNLTIGLKSQLTEENSLELEAGVTGFSTERLSINGLGAFSFSNQSRTIRFTGSRSNVEESLLSVTGVRPVSEKLFVGVVVT